MKEIEPVEDAFPVELNQGVKEDVKEKKQVPITVLSEEEERSLSDETRVHIKQDIHTHAEEEIMSRRKKMKVVELASITHQGKVLKMLGEVGMAWRPKTRPKKKLRLNMKKLLNPKLTEKKITVIEDSSSQEKLEDNDADVFETENDLNLEVTTVTTNTYHTEPKKTLNLRSDPKQVVHNPKKKVVFPPKQQSDPVLEKKKSG